MLSIKTQKTGKSVILGKSVPWAILAILCLVLTFVYQTPYGLLGFMGGALIALWQFYLSMYTVLECNLNEYTLHFFTWLGWVSVKWNQVKDVIPNNDDLVIRTRKEDEAYLLVLKLLKPDEREHFRELVRSMGDKYGFNCSC